MFLALIQGLGRPKLCKKSLKFAIARVFQGRQTSENPYVLALIRSLGRPKMVKNH